jgi:xanthine dehydrogenase accessory factor
MSFDREGLITACRDHGVVARVVVAAVRGSAPRDVGAAMLVWEGGQSGTIGGGALEYQLAQQARRTLQPGHFNLSKHPLGPQMGQCCGGSVDIVTEIFDTTAATALDTHIILRGRGIEPLAVARLRAEFRNSGQIPKPQLLSGWMIEPVHAPTRPVWIWGAGHVGRALVDTLRPMPDFGITWIDTHRDRFPATVPAGIEKLIAANPTTLVPYAPAMAEHLVLTYSHALDLELCHGLLRTEFAFAGLIGSRTKWARFKKRLRALGHSDASIARITCPIGAPDLGKHPQAIAIGVAAGFLRQKAARILLTESRA